MEQMEQMEQKETTQRIKYEDGFQIKEMEDLGFSIDKLMHVCAQLGNIYRSASNDPESAARILQVEKAFFSRIGGKVALVESMASISSLLKGGSMDPRLKELLDSEEVQDGKTVQINSLSSVRYA